LILVYLNHTLTLKVASTCHARKSSISLVQLDIPVWILIVYLVIILLNLF